MKTNTISVIFVRIRSVFIPTYNLSFLGTGRPGFLWEPGKARPG
jgi:hypothetical protein